MTTARTRAASVFAAAALTAAGVGLLAAPAGAATTSTPTTPTAAACDQTPWGGAVQGTPHVAAGNHGGDYLWHNSHGFHLAVTHASHDRRIYSGEITASAPMRIDPVKLEHGDLVKLSANRRSLVFVFSNHGYIDGVNFHTDCASTLTVKKLHVGSSNLNRHDVYLGAAKAHPASIPVTLRRRPVPTT